MKKKLYWLKQNIFPIASVAMTGIVIWRFNFNFDSYEKALKKEKIFDVRRANEQLKIYRQIYNPDNDLDANHRLYNAASEEDKSKIKELFKKYDNMDKESIEKQIKTLKTEIGSLEDNDIKHQGVKLAKVYYGYEPSEDALKKIRQNYNEHRKKVDEEDKKK